MKTILSEKKIKREYFSKKRRTLKNKQKQMFFGKHFLFEKIYFLEKKVFFVKEVIF